MLLTLGTPAAALTAGDVPYIEGGADQRLLVHELGQARAQGPFLNRHLIADFRVINSYLI